MAAIRAGDERLLIEYPLTVSELKRREVDEERIEPELGELLPKTVVELERGQEFLELVGERPRDVRVIESDVERLLLALVEVDDDDLGVRVSPLFKDFQTLMTSDDVSGPLIPHDWLHGPKAFK
jgi:hypothetical protein